MCTSRSELYTRTCSFQPLPSSQKLSIGCQIINWALSRYRTLNLVDLNSTVAGEMTLSPMVKGYSSVSRPQIDVTISLLGGYQSKSRILNVQHLVYSIAVSVALVHYTNNVMKLQDSSPRSSHSLFVHSQAFVSSSMHFPSNSSSRISIEEHHVNLR